MASNRELRARITALNQELRQNERDCIQVITERDHNAEMADKLADAIGDYFGQDIGEHSNVNCPWTAALEMIDGLRLHPSTGQKP